MAEWHGGIRGEREGITKNIVKGGSLTRLQMEGGSRGVGGNRVRVG